MGTDGLQELEAAVEAATGTARLRAMAELAQRVTHEDRGRARRLASEAREGLESACNGTSVSKRDQGSLATILTVLAIDRVCERDHQQAVELAERARGLAERADAAKTLVIAESVIANVLVVRGHIDEARELLVRRLADLPSAGAQAGDLKGRLLNDIGRVHFHAGDPIRARACFVEALDALRTSPDTRIEATCLTNLASVLSHVGDIEGALEAYRDSLALHRTTGLRRGVALTLHNLGVLHGHVGDHELALQYARDAEVELQAGDPDSIAAPNLLHLGEALLALEQPAEALECAERALALERAAGNEVGVARALTGMARVLRGLGREDEAMSHAQEALRTLLAQDAPAWRVECMQVIVELHLVRGHVPLALRMVDTLLEEARSIGDPSLEMDSLRLAVQTMRRAGRHEAALSFSERLQELEAAWHRNARAHRIESLKLRQQLDQARHREQASREAKQELERLVAERTTELVAANEGRLELQAQLQHAQKMEAIGRLAAEVAHDFNDVLTIIGASAEALETGGDHGDPSVKLTRDIREATARGAALTRQLLAFGRHADDRRDVVDVGELVRESESILRRMTGDGVTLVLGIDGGAGRVIADAARLDQALMNLVSNARDAMPAGGTLTISTHVAHVDDALASRHAGSRTGAHVVLAVTDTGLGMDAATRARVFEPFFTTKAAGKGTGLGLAVVFGVVQSCGGFVVVQSEPGKGATFSLHLPRVEPESARTTAPDR